MAPVAGRPFLEVILGQLLRAGFTRVVLSVGYLHATIERDFGSTFNGLPLEYAVEEEPLGTGGAIRSALTMTTEESALVLNGDTFLDANYAAMLQFHKNEGATMTMAVTPPPNVARYGGVLVRNKKLVGFREKSQVGAGWISAGAYVLQHDLSWPPSLADRFSFETDFMMPEIGRLDPAAFEVNGFFLDIGIPEDLDRAQTELAEFMI